MCEATVYMEQAGRREKVLEDVVRIGSSDVGIILTKLFAPPHTIRATIRGIDFLKHTVTLELRNDG
jgi:predicted RNA-binding protein